MGREPRRRRVESQRRPQCAMALRLSAGRHAEAFPQLLGQVTGPSPHPVGLTCSRISVSTVARLLRAEASASCRASAAPWDTRAEPKSSTRRLRAVATAAMWRGAGPWRALQRGKGGGECERYIRRLTSSQVPLSQDCPRRCPRQHHSAGVAEPAPLLPPQRRPRRPARGADGSEAYLSSPPSPPRAEVEMGNSSRGIGGTVSADGK